MAAPHNKVLDAATGWLELGNWQEAHEELKRLPAGLHRTPQVLLLRCRIYAHSGRWSAVEMIAEGAAQAYPQNSHFYTHWAWALHRQGRTEEALGTASTFAARFPESGAIAYAMACLHGALGQVPEAKGWLALAFERATDPDKMKHRTINQPELNGVWRADGKAGKG